MERDRKAHNATTTAWSCLVTGKRPKEKTLRVPDLQAELKQAAYSISSCMCNIPIYQYGKPGGEQGTSRWGSSEEALDAEPPEKKE